jgi:uncharacterized protein YaaQ
VRLILAVIQSSDAGKVMRALTERGMRVTRLASTGGFLREGNVTFLTGVPEDQVDAALEAVRTHARRRTKIMAASDVAMPAPGVLASDADWVEVAVGGATVFVLDIARSEHL